MRNIVSAGLLFSAIGYSSLSIAYDRCHVEAASGGNSICSLPAFDARIICVGQAANRTANCNLITGEPVQCELRLTKLREPSDIWCEMSTPTPGEVGVATLLSGGDRHRYVGQSETTKPTNKPVANAENCDVIKDNNQRVRCLKRKAATDGVIPYEDCNSLVTADKGTWSERIEQKRRQSCLDRQAGIESPPSKTQVCQKINGQMSICR